METDAKLHSESFLDISLFQNLVLLFRGELYFPEIHYKSALGLIFQFLKNKDFLHDLAQSGDSLVKAMALTILIVAGELEEKE